MKPISQASGFEECAQSELVDHGFEQGINDAGGCPHGVTQAGSRFTQRLHKQSTSPERLQQPVGRYGDGLVERCDITVLSQALAPGGGPNRVLVCWSHEVLMCVVDQTKFAQKDLLSRDGRLHSWPLQRARLADGYRAAEN